MTKQNEFVDYLVELLSPLGNVKVKSMFGGYGIYRGSLMFGLVVEDILYLKVDDEIRPKFEERDLKPFTYLKEGKEIKISYYQTPEEALDNSSELCRWAIFAYGAALRAKEGKSTRKKDKQ